MKDWDLWTVESDRQTPDSQAESPTHVVPTSQTVSDNYASNVAAPPLNVVSGIALIS